MTMNNPCALAWTLIAIIAANPVSANDGNWALAFEAAAGAQYDSNVGISDLDTNSGTPDSVVLLSAGGGLKWNPAASSFAASIAYDYSGASHNRFEMFDLDLHHGVAELQYRNRAIDSALTLDRFEGVLDGDPYVSITQISPGIAHLFNERVYLRAAWIGSARDYELLAERSAKATAVRVDAYLLLESLEQYISIGVQRTDETANAAEFSYRGFQMSLGYMHTFELSSMRLKLKSSLRYEDRDYGAISPSIGERRNDRRWRTDLDAEVPFSDHVSLHATLAYTDNASNLESAILEKSIAGLELRIAF